MTDTQGQPQRPVSGGRHRVYTSALIALAALLAYCVYQGWSLPGEQLALVLLIICLGAWPAIRWLQTQPYQFPVFEACLLTGIPSYALPLISSHATVLTYSDTVIIKSMLAVLLFQVAALLTFSRTTAAVKHTPFWTGELFTRDISSWLPIGLWLNTGYIALSSFTELISLDIDSILRAVFFGIATACSFMLGRQWGAGELSQSRRLNVLFALLAGSVLLMSSLYLIKAISSVVIFFLAYISAGRRIPILALGLLFIVLTVLHNGKAAMREKYWAIGAPAVELNQLPDFFSEWVEYGLAPFRDEAAKEEQRELLDRASLLHIICLVVEATDSGLPFLSGKTYGHVLPQFIPRFFWDGKPSGQITTSQLGIHFGLLDEESAKKTSIGFGVLAESYANFGYWGVGLLGLLIGWLNKLVTTWTRVSPMLSNGGLFMILLMAWSIQVELPMSNWLASLYQASICVLGIPYVIKRLFN